MLTRLLVLSILAIAPTISVAQSLGVHGSQYDIEEEDAVGYMKRRMTEWQKDGTIKRKQEEAKQKVIDTVMHPKPIPGISTAIANKTFYWDPTKTLDKPIVDGKGRIIYPVGARINPLAYGGLSKRLIFIDARDPAQVEFAIQGKKANPKDKIILTGGSWVEVSRKINAQAFYDQSGYLTRTFGIHHVPAVVQQEGLKLRVEEKLL